MPPIRVPVGRSLLGEIIPKAGGLSTQHEFPVVEGTRIFGIDAQGIPILRATAKGGRWEPAEPVLTVAEGFLVDAAQEFIWSPTYPSTLANCTNLIVTAQPADELLATGESATLTTEVDGASRVRWQWYKDGAALAGETNQALRLTQPAPESFGDYWADLSCDAFHVRTRTAAVAGWSGPPKFEWRREGAGNVRSLRILGFSSGHTVLEASSDLAKWNVLAMGKLRLPLTLPMTNAVFSSPKYRYFRTISGP